MRRLIISLAYCATMIAASVLVPSPATALPCFEQRIEYWTDENCNVSAGEYHLTCPGATLRRGVETDYWTVLEFCCGNEGCNLEGDGCGSEGQFLGCYTTPNCINDRCA